MSYEILYKRFIVKDSKGELTPYIICGSNNCFEVSGKRERSFQNVLKWEYYTTQFDTTNLREYLGNVYKGMLNCGCWSKLPKTLNGFVNGFYNKIIEEKDFLDNAECMEERLNRMFKTERKVKTVWELHEENEHKPLLELDLNNIPQQQILFYDEYKNLVNKGKIKKCNNGDIGFFKSRSKRYYTPLRNLRQYYYKVV